jgi:hypothetical protein
VGHGAASSNAHGSEVSRPIIMVENRGQGAAQREEAQTSPIWEKDQRTPRQLATLQTPAVLPS